MLGLFAAWRGSSKRGVARWGATAIAMAAVVAAVLTPSDRLANLLHERCPGTLIYYVEGQGGTVAVIEQGTGRNRFRRLYIQGVSNTGDAMPSLRYMRLQALLPLIIHGGHRNRLWSSVWGRELTAGATLRFPGLEQRVVAELLPQVRQASSKFQGNFDALADPRLDIHLRDGRRELLSNEQTYDLIHTRATAPVSSRRCEPLFERFYKLARTRLRQGGLVAQWLPLSTQNDQDTRFTGAQFS